ncbi:MAG: hypothetical protein QM523_11320, partial [Candidatus Pacebacteria bacterium]|nr:hypothetical protein [Candidatus Paceibacterota bacterium]
GAASQVLLRRPSPIGGLMLGFAQTHLRLRLKNPARLRLASVSIEFVITRRLVYEAKRGMRRGESIQPAVNDD